MTAARLTRAQRDFYQRHVARHLSPGRYVAARRYASPIPPDAVAVVYVGSAGMLDKLAAKGWLVAVEHEGRTFYHHPSWWRMTATTPTEVRD